MWGILGPLLGIGAGIGIHELFLKSEPLSEVVKLTTNEKTIQLSSSALTKAGIKHDIHTDGKSSWIVVKPSDRIRAAQVIQQAFQV